MEFPPKHFMFVIGFPLPERGNLIFFFFFFFFPTLGTNCLCLNYQPAARCWSRRFPQSGPELILRGWLGTRAEFTSSQTLHWDGALSSKHDASWKTDWLWNAVDRIWMWLVVMLLVKANYGRQNFLLLHQSLTVAHCCGSCSQQLLCLYNHPLRVNVEHTYLASSKWLWHATMERGSCELSFEVSQLLWSHKVWAGNTPKTLSWLLKLVLFVLFFNYHCFDKHWSNISSIEREERSHMCPDMN